MIFKESVNLELEPAMAKALPGIEAAHREILERGAIVTSANDSVHGPNSLHPKGMAVDLRGRDLNEATKLQLAARLRLKLNGDENVNRPYQVVVEQPPKNHLHVEYDPR